MGCCSFRIFRGLFNIINKECPLHPPIFASFHQDIILHIQVVHQWQVRLMNRLIRVWVINPSQLPNSHIASTGIHINAVALWIVFCKYCSHRTLFLLIVESIIRYKNQKHFNQFTMSHLFCVIMCYIIFLPLSEFVNSYGKI